MANKTKYLIPKDSNQSRVEAKANGIKGGIQLGINNKRRRSYKEIMNTLMSTPISKTQEITLYEKTEDGGTVAKKVNLVDFIKDKYPNVPHDEIDICIFATMRMIELINHPKAEVAMKAFELVRDTSGQKPKDDSKASTTHNNFFGSIAEKVGEATQDLINVTPTKDKKKTVFDLI